MSSEDQSSDGKSQETQGSTQLFEEEPQSQENEPPYWGQLCSMNEALPSLKFTTPEILVGRSAPCAIRVSDLRISQIHFKIVQTTEPDGSVAAVLEDLRF